MAWHSIRWLLILAATFVTAASATPPPVAARVALVIGNAAYPAAPLQNAGHDATGMAATLADMGFTVLQVRDGTRARMVAALAEARAALQGKEAVALLYYAGHAVQLDWRNYLLPVDAAPSSATEVVRQAIDVQEFIDAFRQAGARVNIVVLDACRDNPFGTLASGQGLAPLDAPPGTFLAYATGPGNVADDGEPASGNGLYTGFLLQELRKPDARIEDIFKRVRFRVRQQSQGKQVPWESTSLEDEFVFATGRKAAEEPRSDQETAFLREREVWERVKASTRVEDFYAFLQAHPGGAFAEQAQFRLERLAAPAFESSRSRSEARVLPVERDRYRVGDVLQYDAKDTRSEEARRVTYRVTAVDADRVEVNGGTVVWDAMGNLVRNSGGTRDPAKVMYPAQLAVGKSWRTSYQIRNATGLESVFYRMRVAALEEVEVPAGRFKAYRVEGSGWSSRVAGHELSDTYWIDPATFVIVKSLWTSRAKGKVLGSSARELRNMRLVPRS